MKPSTILLIVAALAFSGFAAFFAKKVVTEKPAMVVGEGGKPVKAEPMTKVLIAAKNLTTGTVISSKDLIWQKWPVAAVGSMMISGGANASSADFRELKDQYIGMTVERDFLYGEPIISTKVFNQSGAGFLSGVIAPGMRAYSMPVNKDSGTIHLIKAGDRIDVILVSALESMLEGPEGGQASLPVYQRTSETVLRNIQVLAVDYEVETRVPTGGGPISSKKKKKKAAKKTKKKLPKNITVEVTPKQAQILALAQNMGKISVVLRSQVDGEGGEDMSYTTDLDVSGALTEVFTSVRKSVFDRVQMMPSQDGSSPVAMPQTKGMVKIYRGNNVTIETTAKK